MLYVKSVCDPCVYAMGVCPCMYAVDVCPCMYAMDVCPCTRLPLYPHVCIQLCTCVYIIHTL